MSPPGGIMTSKNHLRALNILTILVFLVSMVGVQPGQAASISPSELSRPKAATNVSPTPGPDNLRYGYSSNTGKLNFVGGDASAPLMAASAGGISAQSVESASAAVLSRYGAGFGLKDPSQELKLERTSKSSNGDTLRYQQSYQGIPVMGGEMLINSDMKGNILSLNGKVSPDLTLDSTTPAISADQAIKAALAGMQSWYKIDPTKTTASQPALWIYDERIFKPSQLPVVLAWRMDVQGNSSSGPVNELVLVNTQTGEIALHFNQVDNFTSQQMQEGEATETVTDSPTETPTIEASATEVPTLQPTETSNPTDIPTVEIQPSATEIPSQAPTQKPTQTANPTDTPTVGITPSVTPKTPGVVQAQSGKTWYVATTGNDSNDCASAASPCATINGGLGKAAAGDTIKVAAGTYTGTGAVAVFIVKSITLSGGWNVNFTSQTGFSTVDGENVMRGIDISTTSFNVTIERFIVINSYSAGYGSAIYASPQSFSPDSTLTIRNSSFHHNFNSQYGTIYTKNVKNLDIINTTIGENRAGDGGGLFIDNSFQAILQNVTIVNNSALSNFYIDNTGGIVFNPYADYEGGANLSINNSIIANNSANTGSYPDFYSSSTTSSGYNLITNTNGWFNFTPKTGDIIGQDPKLGAINALGYYPLIQNSPAIDHSNPAAPGKSSNACAATDQFGTLRPIDGDGDGKAICDIGAYETNPPDLSIPNSIAVSGGSPQTRALLHAYGALSVVVKDQYGAPLPGVSVTFSAPSTDASGTFADTSNTQTTATTNASGIATSATFSANEATGQFTVQASVPGVAAPAQFQFENYIQAPAKIAVAAGNNQYASHLRPFAISLQAYVEDTYSHPMDGTTVTFSAPSSGASGSFASSGNQTTTSTADKDGIASAVFIANTTQGSYSVHATAADLSQEIDFNLTNKDIYVSPDGVDPSSKTGNECTDPASPCRKITYAVSKASPGTTIFIGSGIYAEGDTNLLNSNFVTLSGGWNEEFDRQTKIPSIVNNIDLEIYPHNNLDISNLTIYKGNIWNNGTLKIENSAYINGYYGIGNSGTASIINTTISGGLSNYANAPIYGLKNTGNMLLLNDTISGVPGDGIISNSNLTIKNSVIAGNQWNCVASSGTLTSAGHNLFSSIQHDYYHIPCIPIGTDLVDVDPKLSALVNQSYFALQAGSPAIDAIDPNDSSTTCAETDQRGVKRPVGNNCDIGAFEYTPPGQPAALSIFSGTNQSIGPNRSFQGLLQAQVLDSTGAPVSGVTVTFTAPSTGPSGTFSGGEVTSSAVSDESGVASAALFTSNGIIGNYFVNASVACISEAAAFSLENANLFVSINGNDGSNPTSNDCRTLTSPCKTISHALNQAKPGYTIFIAGGNYVEDLSIKLDSILLSGGWNDSFTSQNDQTIFTPLENNYDPDTINSASNVEISNLTIKFNVSGIINSGVLTLRNSSITVSWMINEGVMTVINSTIRDTYLNNAGENLSILNSTLKNDTGNYAIDNGSYSGTINLTIQNSIISGICNVGHGSITSNGNNIFTSASGCTATSPGTFTPNNTDKTGIDPKLSSLINGQYYALHSDSPAIDAGNTTVCPTTDQRGLNRPVGSQCDIGAYEFKPAGQPATLSVYAGDNQFIGTKRDFGTQLQAIVLDSVGSPVPGVTVTFNAPALGASGVFASGDLSSTAVTDESGIASAPVLTSNNVRGSYTISASVEGVPQLANYHLTNQDLFVSPAGSDTNPSGNNCGDPAFPCQTISYAINQARSGDTIFIASGTYGSSIGIYNLENLFLSGGWDNTFGMQSGQSILANDGSYGQDLSVWKSSALVEHIDIDVNNGISNSGTLEFKNGSIGSVSNTGNLSLKNAGIRGLDNKAGNVSLTNVTIEGGSGLENEGGTASLTNVTITEIGINISTFSSGIYNKSGTVTLKNTIVAQNRGGFGGYDCSGTITSLGHNLIGIGDGCGFIPAAGDRIGTVENPLDAGLNNPTDNGGYTLTAALRPGSPAIDAGDPNGCPTTDQRGVARPVGAGCDIGAYEGVGPNNPAPFAATFNLYTFDCQSPITNCTDGKDTDADNAHLNAIGTYQFFWDHFNRNGLDNAGMPIISIVHSTVNPNNAVWNGSQLVYANGFPKADDVAAHELTHGVIQYEANLFNYYQSGAIGESLADLFGEWYDQTNGRSFDITAAKWLIGEDLPGGAIRSMSNPPTYNDPDKITSSYYSLGTNDNGGVHRNSGVNNKAVYLMVDGGTFNSKVVTSLNWDKTGAIYYYALTHLLTSASNYQDLYNDLDQSCRILVGMSSDNLTLTDCQQVRNATDAVQMNYTTSDLQYDPDITATCPNGSSKGPDVLFSDDMEYGSQNWTFQTLVGKPHWSISYQNVGMRIGTIWRYVLYGDDSYNSNQYSDEPSDSVAAMKSGIAVPSGVNTFLFFKHAFAFNHDGSNYYHGGVLEYTIDNGVTWIDAKALFDAGKNYSGTLDGITPLGIRDAFVGESNGYVSSRYNLTSLAGKTVKFRWRLGTEETSYAIGWLVNNVSVYKCVLNPEIPGLIAPADGSQINTFQPILYWDDSEGAISYQLEMAIDPYFTNLLISLPNLPATSSQFPITFDIPFNKLIYWHIRAVNSINIKSAWSPTWSFSIPLAIPILSVPVNGSTINNLRPTFSWSASPAANSYTLVVSTSSNYTSPLVNLTFLAGSTTYTPTKDLPAGKKLYARIMANGTVPSAWNSIYFTTPVPPNIPVLAAPANNALLVNAIPDSYQPVLSWKPASVPSRASAFDHYELQLSDAADFSNLLVPNDPHNPLYLTTPSYQIPATLLSNHQYFWRVCDYNKNGDFSDWSAFAFRTAIIQPTANTPDDGSTQHSLRPSFTWNTPAGATSYTLQISTKTNLSSPVLNTSVFSLPYTPSVDLPGGKLYYWRVRANGLNGPSLWSSVLRFSTPLPPSVPVLVSPVNNALLTSYHPSLSWKPVTVVKGSAPFKNYEVDFSDKANFSNVLFPDGSSHTASQTATNFQIPDALPDNQQYFWRVRADNTNGDFSSWAVFSFHTAIIPPNPSSPANDPANALKNLRPQFKWNTPAGASSYTLVVSPKANLSSPVLNVTVMAGPYMPTIDLPSGKQLYWQVRANGLNGSSLWSSVWSFKTPLPPSIPILVSPDNNALLTSYQPNLSWKAVTVTKEGFPFSNYELDLSDKADFSNILFPNSSGHTASQTTTTFLVPAALPDNQQYFWRVRADNTNGDFSSWAVFSFRTAMVAPTLNLPANDPINSINTLKPLFNWNGSGGASSYTIVISTSSTLSSQAVNTTLATTSYTPTTNLPAGKVLYWHVRANGVNGPSLWSSTWSFREK